MISYFRYWQYQTPSPFLGYSLAVLLAAAAQAARIPLDQPTLMPHISYVPFILLSAALGGFGPGLLTTAICLLESVYFATEPVGTFRVADPRLWGGLGALAFTGLVTCILFDSLKRAWRSYAAAAAGEAQVARERQAEQRMLQSIVQNSPVAIAVLHGPDFTFSMVNPAHLALVPGATPGRTVASVWKAGASLLLPILNVVRNSQTVYHAKDFAVPVDRGEGLPGEERYFNLSFAPLSNSGGDVEVLVVAIETTEQKRAQAGLRAAYSQLAAIYANAPVLLLVIDDHLRVREANDLAARFAGTGSGESAHISPGNALGCLNALADPLGCGHGPACAQCPLRAAILDTLDTGTRHDGIEAWLPERNGGVPQERCLLISTTAMGLDRDNHVLVCAHDITERKQAEVELARQRDELERQAALINLAHDAIVTADANRVIRSWNRGAEEMYGWVEAEAVGNVMHLFLRAGNSEALSGDQWNGELEHTRRDGRRIRVESRQVMLRNAAGNDVRILEINRDITERRQAEDALKRTVAQLESALAEKTVLLQEVHHRVKNNLAVTASLLSMKAQGCGPEARAALEESQQRIHSIALVHELLYASERLDRIDFGEYARQLAQGVHSAFDGGPRGITLDWRLDPVEMGIERAVPCALILNELLSNAFKYAFPDGRSGRILISFLQPEPGHCELAVEDDGAGMPAGALDRQDGPGGSLGLRIVAILSRQLDGRLERQECGTGTRIVLRFPAAR